MNSFYFLEASTVTHHESGYLDAEFVKFDGSETINSRLESNKVDLFEIVFRFKLLRESLENRDFLLTNKRWLVVSPSLKKILEQFQSLVSYSTEIIDQNGALVNDQYSLIKLDHLEGLLNLVNSDLTMSPVFPDKILGIKKLVTNPDFTTSEDVFLMKEYPIKTVVSEKVKTKIELSSIKGIELSKIDEYDW